MEKKTIEECLKSIVNNGPFHCTATWLFKDGESQVASIRIIAWEDAEIYGNGESNYCFQVKCEEALTKKYEYNLWKTLDFDEWYLNLDDATALFTAPTKSECLIRALDWVL